MQGGCVAGYYWVYLTFLASIVTNWWGAHFPCCQILHVFISQKRSGCAQRLWALLHMHIWACWKNLIFPNHEFVKGHYVKLYCFVEGKKRSSEISGHQVVTRWSQSGHQVVTRWVLGGQQVVIKTWIFNSFLILKYVSGSKMILKHSNKNTIYKKARWTFEFPPPASSLILWVFLKLTDNNEWILFYCGATIFMSLSGKFSRNNFP